MVMEPEFVGDRLEHARLQTYSGVAACACFGHCSAQTGSRILAQRALELARPTYARGGEHLDEHCRRMRSHEQQRIRALPRDLDQIRERNGGPLAHVSGPRSYLT